MSCEQELADSRICWCYRTRVPEERWQAAAVSVGAFARVLNGQTAFLFVHGIIARVLSGQTAGSVHCIVPVGVCLAEGKRVAPRLL